MNDQQLADGLAQKGAVIVHFSHYSNMGRPLTFPADLQTAIRDRAKWPLSCSVLFPGHTMTPVGSVGVIFTPRVANVLSVSNNDAGAFSGPDDIDQSGGRALDTASFHWSFEVVGTYNEWRVKGADVGGIFVLDPANIWVKRSVAYPDPTTNREEWTIAPEKISINEIFSAFPNEDVFTLGPHGLIQLN